MGESQHKKAVHFGAGNIGRGFIGPLLTQSGYHVTFVDVQEEIIQALNTEEEYPVHILDKESQVVEVHDFDALKSGDPRVHDAIAEAHVVTTSVGPSILEKVSDVVAAGIVKHRANGVDWKLDVIACENMVNATSLLEELVKKSLEDKGQHDDLKYAEENVGFANCEVDRIVPELKERENILAVGVEGFFEWIVEQPKLKGDFNVEGVRLVANLTPYLERKLYTLNCGHAMYSFLGYVKGYHILDEAVADKELESITRAALEESGAALIRKHGFEEGHHHRYINRTMARYANPNVHDDVARVSRNPLRKVSPKERLVGAIDTCKEFDLPRDHLLKGVAAAFHFDNPDDEEAVELTKMVKEKGIAAAVTDTTKFEEGSYDHDKVVKEYEELKKWKAKSKN